MKTHPLLMFSWYLLSYVFLRKYAERRIRDYFKEKKYLKDAASIDKEYQKGLEMLQMLKRQVGCSLACYPLLPR